MSGLLAGTPETVNDFMGKLRSLAQVPIDSAYCPSMVNGKPLIANGTISNGDYSGAFIGLLIWRWFHRGAWRRTLRG